MKWRCGSSSCVLSLQRGAVDIGEVSVEESTENFFTTVKWKQKSCKDFRRPESENVRELSAPKEEEPTKTEKCHCSESAGRWSAGQNITPAFHTIKIILSGNPPGIFALFLGHTPYMENEECQGSNTPRRRCNTPRRKWNKSFKNYLNPVCIPSYFHVEKPTDTTQERQQSPRRCSKPKMNCWSAQVNKKLNEVNTKTSQLLNHGRDKFEGMKQNSPTLWFPAISWSPKKLPLRHPF